MFLRKNDRKVDKEITRTNRLKEKECKDCIIDVKLEHGEEIFSQYNYEDQTTLNEDFSEFLWHNAKLSPVNRPLTIKIYAQQELRRRDVSKAIKNHYREEYMDAKNELRTTNRFALATLILGILFLGLFVVFYELVNNYVLDTIAEIIAWVFIWESVYAFFLKRASLMHKCRRIQRLYSAKIQIIEKSKV